jgi:transcriptional regulator with XRE-family HTH domain
MLNQQKKRRRPLAFEAFDRWQLKRIRDRLGLSLGQVQKMTGIATSSLWDYEHGKIVPQLHQFKKLCEAYTLDPTEVCELMRFKIYEAALLRNFRQACKVQGKAPAQIFYELMMVYVDNVKRKLLQR